MSDELKDNPEFRRAMGEVAWLALAAEKYADEMGLSQGVANYSVATNWSAKQAKRYVETGKKPWED